MKLFSKSKGGPAEKKQLMELLTFIVAQTRTVGYATVPKTVADKIGKLEPGLIEIKLDAQADPAGNIPARATSKGFAAVLGEDGAVEATTETATKSEFALETGFVLPVSKRGGIKASTYPFAQMQPGQSFFVPATDERPNPAKSLASTASSASKKFASTGRKFVARPRIAGVDGEKQNGARIYCVSVVSVGVPADAMAQQKAA